MRVWVCETYFVPEEGFLAGLALNNENVTFNESYKKILRFYGFDLDNDQLPTFLPQGNNNTANENTTTAPLNPTSTVQTITTFQPSTLTTASITKENKPREETTPSLPNTESTINPNVETITPGSSTTANPSSASNIEDALLTTSIITTISTSSREPAPLETTSEMTTVPVSTENQNVLSTIENTLITTTPNVQTTTDTLKENSSETSTTEETITSNEIDNGTTRDLTSNMIVTSSISETSTSTSAFSTTFSNTETTQITNMMTLETEQTATSLGETTEIVDSSSTTASDTTLETLERRKKSIVDFLFTNPPYVHDYMSYRSFDIPADLPTHNFDDKMFLANGLKSVQVSYMHYDTILEHAYLPHLEASALRLPLDSERYYLLVVLPARRGPAELDRLLSRMARESDLSDIYAALRPRRVRGSVPSFIVKGHVTLTTDLQKLGIRNVFEPRQHDFTQMTNQAGVYVRSIEQAVSVAIRKYRPDEYKRNRYVTNREPITFFATYPFLYFVMDASIHVSLMAGKMVDPLNTRIL
ncbi:endochitinase A isoform X2 [Manduca sexta]|uniref:endochitinase A isoform X2 n=1 Tax=Manduca sexta TaxID=7130 RepID=UPI00118368A5|nr:endochitinase A isoform X2 [Manduca sexta]